MPDHEDSRASSIAPLLVTIDGIVIEPESVVVTR